MVNCILAVVLIRVCKPLVSCESPSPGVQRKQTIIRKDASLQLIRAVYVRGCRQHAVFYSGFGAGQGTHMSTCRAAVYVKNDGKSRRPCCDG